jgi:DNA topoisomerase-1
VKAGRIENQDAARIVEKLQDPAASARAAGLHYVNDQDPGIERVRKGRGFIYRSASGKVIRDPAVLRRIQSLAIPPAWTRVWICPDPNGHLQATGRDDRGRKQFRYHPRWREVRDETKYARMIMFGQALPKIRRRLRRDLRLADLPRNKVLATVVRLLEVSLIRVGNEEYARENESFGLTTMRNRHVDIRGGTLRFHFRGKSGKWHNVDIEDRRLAKIIRTCQHLPGQELFQFVDDDGERHNIRSDDVNDYLREITGEDFTAKDFRTWFGTVLAATELAAFEAFKTKAEAKKNLVAAIASVAGRLGNTPAICKKCYVHPHVFDSYLEGTLAEGLARRATNLRARTGLHPEETAVLRLLRRKWSLEQRLTKALRHEKVRRGFNRR